MIEKFHLPIRRVTHGEGHWFFGYFDKFPWDRSGRYLLALNVPFTARQPVSGEKASFGIIDLHDNDKFTKLGETDAWCWQQACMLQYLNDDDHCIIYNDRENDHFVSRIMNIKTGETRTLCRPIYCLSPDGRWALSVNFSKLDKERPGYGYPGVDDPLAAEDCPDNDGVFLVDLKNNTAELIISLKSVKEKFYRPEMADTKHWFNHLLFSPDSSRIAFFHRWRMYRPDGSPWHITHMYTANRDGSDIYPLNLDDCSSHYTWINNEQIINFSLRHKSGYQYHLFTDKSDKIEIIGKDVFPFDGHCSYSPDGKWMLTDSYPLEDQCRKLFLHHLASEKTFEIGSFYADPDYPIPTRCDLHPNWSRDGKSVCIDSIHEDSRQMYLLDVTPLTSQFN